MHDNWFSRLTGFNEEAYAPTQAQLEVQGNTLRSKVNGRSFGIGQFEMVSLAELRQRVAQEQVNAAPTQVSIVTGDVRQMHQMPQYARALFQVASQFNALEMVAPSVTPEDGVTRYEHDRTQGPACAMAAGLPRSTATTSCRWVSRSARAPGTSSMGWRTLAPS